MGHEHGTCMNMYETWTWGMCMGYVWTCMKLGHGACLCDSCYRLMVMVGVWCQTFGIMFRWWTSTVFVLKLLESFGNGGLVKECWWVGSDVEPMIKGDNNQSTNKQFLDFILFCKKHVERQ
jgi:hypothetical protein